MLFNSFCTESFNIFYHTGRGLFIIHKPLKVRHVSSLRYAKFKCSTRKHFFKILERCFLCTMCITMFLAFTTILRPYTSMSPAAEGLNLFKFYKTCLKFMEMTVLTLSRRVTHPCVIGAFHLMMTSL